VSLTILDATTLASVRAATTQVDQLAALIAAWGGAAVTVKSYATATLRDTGVYGTWVLDSATPRGMTLGAMTSRSISNGAAPTRVVFCKADNTEIFQLTAGASGDVTFTGLISTSHLNLADPSSTKMKISATASLTAPAVPTWLSSITVGQWGVVTSTSLTASGVGWSGTTPNTGGIGGTYTELLAAYSGGILNTHGFYAGATWHDGPALILWGGGHGNYAGNEVYALSLNTDTPTWYRLRDPTVPGPDDVAQDGNGNPVSRHTYASISYIYDGTKNWMFSYGGIATYHTANTIGQSHVFDFNVASPNSNSPWLTKASTPHTQGSYHTAYETSSGRVWGLEYNAGSLSPIAYYDVATNAYTYALDKAGQFGSHGCTDIDSSRGLWVIFTENGLKGYRTNNGVANDFYTVNASAGAPASPQGFLYDPVADKFIAWSGGQTLYTLTPPGSSPYEGGNQWTWANTTPSGSTPTAAETTGTFKRFALVQISTARGYVVVSDAGESVYFYRAA
jgi:hypothetical protein